MEQDPLAVTCPKCGAAPGVPCKRSAAHEGQAHGSRVKAAQARRIAEVETVMNENPYSTLSGSMQMVLTNPIPTHYVLPGLCTVKRLDDGRWDIELESGAEVTDAAAAFIEAIRQLLDTAACHHPS